MEVRREISNAPEAAAQARRLLDPFVSRIPEDVLDDARLALSELVTNSYKHAGSPEGTPIHITLRDSRDRFRLEVIDGSIFDPTPETSEELRSAKWGLLVVQRVADDWGRISEGGIWAEFRLGTPEGRI